MVDGRSALVVYESMLGRTRSLAEAVADVLRTDGVAKVACVPLDHATPRVVEHTALLVVGVPTNRVVERRDVIDLRETPVLSRTVEAWLESLPPGLGRAAAVFDTRPARHGTGAADAVAVRLREAGYELVCPPQGFVIAGPVGPLPPEEWLRAQRWAASRIPTADLLQ